VTVSSYDTQAQANSYAPLDKSAYYTDHSQHNASPASGDVNEDWSGTNVGGSENTWRMTASVHASSTTIFDSNSLTITGAGSFAYNITTTAGFSEPLQHATLFTPGASAGFGAVFTIDRPATYTLSVVLSGISGISFASFTDGYLLNQTHLGSIAKLVTMNGTLQPGQYQIGVGGNAHGPSGLPDGVNAVTKSGAFDSFTFNAQVPEPTCALMLCLLWLGVRRADSSHTRKRKLMFLQSVSG
jgi:hypothetical protein